MPWGVILCGLALIALSWLIARVFVRTVLPELKSSEIYGDIIELPEGAKRRAADTPGGRAVNTARSQCRTGHALSHDKSAPTS
jgi:hypothetical protein